MENNLKELVRQEADNLLKYATGKERGRLSFSSLDAHISGYCIYGQMTGICWSDRARQLLNLCTTPYSDNISEHLSTDKKDFSAGRHFSPIEYYIAQPEAKNAELIAYLRGETNTLDI